MQALLELDCIPGGMELFPATDDDQWTLIKRVIDECDYYVVIIGDRYGSIGPKDINYTEQEHRYAVDSGKPVIAFLHKDPSQIIAGRPESKPQSMIKLREFRDLAQKKVCRYWEGPSELGSAVSRSLVRLINTHPMPGWIRADKAATAVAATEVLRLQKTIEDLQAKLAASPLAAPKGSEELAQGDEPFPIDYTFEAFAADRELWSFSRQLEFTWDEIFQELGPLILDEATDERIRAGLLQIVRARRLEGWQSDEELKMFSSPRNFAVLSRDEQTIKIQLRPLGLIEQSSKARSVKDTRTFWSLTTYGDSVLVQLRAIRRGEFKPEDDVDETDEPTDGRADELPSAAT